MQWLCGLGKMKRVGKEYESTKPRKVKIIEEIKLEL